MKTNLTFLIALISFAISGSCSPDDGSGRTDAGEVGNGNTVIEVPTDARKWMEPLPGDTSLKVINLPGTHNSGAHTGAVSLSLAKCQDWDIAGQLDRGVRFLDIRLKVSDERLRVCHGIINAGIYMEDVLEACYDFMDANPGEAIVMSVRNENDGADSDEKNTFHSLLAAHITAAPQRWFLGNRVPTLGEVRGKIMLFRRYSSPNMPATYGLDTRWSDNSASFTIHSAEKGNGQDLYSINPRNGNGAETKMASIKQSLDRAAADTRGAGFYVNFTSCNSGANNIAKNAEVINPLVEAEFDRRIDGKTRLGWVLFDFPTEKLVRQVWSSNFEEPAQN